MSNTIPRRRVLRPAPLASINPQLQAQRDRLHQALAQERESLRRWMSRLKRAFTMVQKHQNRLSRMERKLAQASN